MRLLRAGQAQNLQTRCDTLVIDADALHLFLIYRAALAWDARQSAGGSVLVRDLDAGENAPATPTENRL